jgi:cobalt-zinc-cadmium efflux system protein
MAKRAASARYTYGFRRTTVLAALSNAVLLFVAVGAVAGEAIGKFWQPAAVPGKTVLFVALFGVLINGASAALFTKHAHDDANVRGAFLHLLTDALVSVGVVVVGALLLWQPSWVWLDPLVSLLISVVILIGTWRLLRDSLHLSLDGVPPRLDRDEVAQYLAQLPGVLSVHDLHIWAISTSESALTTHLVVSDQAPRGLAARASDELAARFGIDHVTVQLDTPEQASNCRTC